MPDPKRLTYIDSLRGLAALSVVVYHAFESSVKHVDPGPWGDLLRPIVQSVDAGRFGVVLFFLISGFVIPFSIRAERATPVRDFLVSRVFRLYPAYWLSLALAVLLIGFFQYDRLSPRAIAADATMMQHALGQPDILKLYWTLAVELIFYGLCLLLFVIRGALFKPRVIVLLSAGLLLLTLLGSGIKLGGGRFHDPMDLLHLGIMFAGFSLRRALVEGGVGRRTAYGLLLLSLVAASAFALAYTRPGDPYQSPGGTVAAYAFALLVFWLGVERARLIARALVYLGDISYSLYLLHAFPIALAQHYLRPNGSLGAGLAYVSATIAASCLIAAVSHRWLEKPAIALGRRINQRRSRRFEGARLSPDAVV